MSVQSVKAGRDFAPGADLPLLERVPTGAYVARRDLRALQTPRQASRRGWLPWGRRAGA